MVLALRVKRKPYREPEYLPVGIPDFQHYRIKDNVFELTLKNPIPQTGSSIDTIILLPFFHELLEIHLKHTDAAGAESTDSMDLAIYKEMSGSWQKIFGRTGYTGTFISGEDLHYKSPGRRYKITSNTTNLHLLEVKILLGVLHA